MNQVSSPALSVQPIIPQCLSINMLLPGDIICTASNEAASRSIRALTHSRFSHAILYRGSELAVDAVPGDGVTVDLLTKKLRGCNDIVAFRHRTASRAQCETAAQWAASQAGKPYDKLGAVRVGLDPEARTGSLRFTGQGIVVIATVEAIGALASDGHDTSFFCSELVLRAFEIAGAPVVNRPPHLTGPGIFLNSSTLVYLGELAA